MTLRNSFPIPWKPSGLSDTLYSGTSFPGAMAELVNLVPDPASTSLWQCRPAALEDADPFPDYTDPGFVSALLVAGTRIYGMMATGTNPGQDEPFCFDIITQTYIVISGVSPTNSPVSPPVTGAWTPPHMEIVGTKIVVTHPGFTGAGGAFFGLLDISDPNALAWSATNTAPVALAVPPTWVAQYNGRAIFLVNPGVGQPAAYMSDSLLPATITNADQILTFGDNVPLTCARGLPLFNQLGGVVQSLIVFKGAANLYQVTGDYSSTATPLAINSLNVATGTLAPNTLATTPFGLAFVSPEGVRVISFQAQVSDPIGIGGLGITTPFIYSGVPSRMAASYAGTVYRVAVVQNDYVAGSPNQEYWYDFSRKIWHGPHTFPASLLQPYNNAFYFTPIQAVPDGRIFFGATVQGASPTFIEDGDQMTWSWKTPLFPNTDQMAENAMIETTLYLSLVVAANVTVYATNAEESVLDTVMLQATGSPTVWGAFIWGAAVWRGASIALSPKQIPWTIPIVFQRLAIQATADSAQGIAIGPMNLRYEQLGYLLQDIP